MSDATHSLQSKALPKTTDVLVIGAGPSGLAASLKLHEYGLNFLCLDANDRAGGNARTEKRNGFACEWGPECFYIPLEDPDFCWLQRALPALKTVVANEASRNRFVVKNGRTVKLGPGIIFTGSLLSFKARLRLLCEPFARSAPPGDESLADFARRRVGPEAYQTLIKPMCSGIFAGDPEVLSLASAFPRFQELDRQGGLFRSGIKGLLRRLFFGKPDIGPRKMVNFEGGMEGLADACLAKLGDKIRLQHKVSALHKTAAGYRVTVEHAGQQSHFETKCLLVTTPAFAMVKMFAESAPALSQELAKLPYCGINVIGLGVKNSQVKRPLSGFGALVGPDNRAESERMKALGYLISSAVFPNRAPEDHSLFRVMIGGAKLPEAVEWTDEQLLEVARKELGTVVGLEGREQESFIFRYQRGIPQYVIGHSQWRDRVEALRQAEEGLYLAGNSFFGPGLADVLRNTMKVVAKLGAEFRERNPKAVADDSALKVEQVAI